MTGFDDMLKQTGKIDFDDMLVMCHELFTERKDILAAWQKKFKYILVDEFQDINLCSTRWLPDVSAAGK